MAGEDALAARARDLAEMLVGWPSVTGTADEAAFAGRLAALLRDSTYFRDHPDHLVLAPIPDDPLGRANVLALVRGSGTRTLLLTGHFDTVPVEDYGDLAHLAGAPGPLREALVARLEASGSDPQALDDLRSGAFVPGRGMLDMKSGVAAALAVLERFAAHPDHGNLLLVATPDEEDRSAGMRAAAAALPGFLARHGLDAVLAVNVDAICDDADGETGRVVMMGCIGKLLLSAFVVGVETHAAYPFGGVNAAYLAAELITEVECAPDLGEVTADEIAAPPTTLGAKDGKAVYNVTTPGDAWLFWNVLLHRRRSGEVLGAARSMAERAIERAAARMRSRAEALGVAGGAAAAWARAAVLTFAEVAARARARDPGFDAVFSAEASRLAARADLDLPERSRRLTRLAWIGSGLEGPAVVLGFGSMPYPAIGWPAGADALEGAIEAAVAEVRSATGVSIRPGHYFPGIADMSFIGPVDGADLRDTARNTPIWGTSIVWPLDRDATPAIPTINIGPWGRDYHHWLERAHADYAFRVLPLLLGTVVRRVLGAADPPRGASATAS